MDIVFRDTVFNIAFDSLENDLGEIEPQNGLLVKYMKYVGKENIFITRAWTTDPHYICGHPTGPLVPGKVYAIRICFWHQGKEGSKMNKSMGFDLSDGNQVVINFKGSYPPLPPAPVKQGPHEVEEQKDSAAIPPNPGVKKRAHDTLKTAIKPAPLPPVNPAVPFDSNLVQVRMASFPGGNDSLYAFIKHHFDLQLIKRIDQKGQIVIAFIVNTDGSLSDFSIKKSLHPELDKELIRVMKKSPKWIPGVCSRIDPGFFPEQNAGYFYCEAEYYVPFRINPGASW